MKRLFLPVLLGFFMISHLHAAQSTIVEADGFACMGYDKSRKQTEEEALTNAKRMAVEHTATYIKSETRVKDSRLEKDLIEAYTNATVKLIEEVNREWYKDATLGDCFRLRVKAEVIPDRQSMEKIAQGQNAAGDPSAPLRVQVWTDKREYKEKDKIRIYIRGNKPFFARVLFKGVKGDLLQLLPNPYRTDHYFNGGMIYEIPAGNDRFDLEVTPPLGEEGIIVYAGTNPLGDIDLKSSGAVYEVKTQAKDIGSKSRTVKVKLKEGGSGSGASEFFEGMVTIRTQ